MATVVEVLYNWPQVQILKRESQQREGVTGNSIFFCQGLMRHKNRQSACLHNTAVSYRNTVIPRILPKDWIPTRTLSVTNTCTVNPLLSPPGAYLFQARLRGSLVVTEGLFNSEKTRVSLLQKDLKYQVEKLTNKKAGGHAAEDQNQYRTSSW